MTSSQKCTLLGNGSICLIPHLAYEQKQTTVATKEGLIFDRGALPAKCISCFDAHCFLHLSAIEANKAD